jgi:hypothetical protein
MSIPQFVIAGLDPAIYPAKPNKIFVLMDARDARVKPAHDEVMGGSCLSSANQVREIAR